MAFVKLSQGTDYGKPYQSMQAAQEQARKEMSYAVSVLAEKKSERPATVTSNGKTGQRQHAK